VPSLWLPSVSRTGALRVAVIFSTLFGIALISRLRVVWIWNTGFGIGDLLGLLSELLVALLAAVLVSRLNNIICTLVAVYWAVMCLIDMENLVAMQTIASLENAGYLFDGDFLAMTLSAASIPHLVSTLLFVLLPLLLLPLILRWIDSKSTVGPVVSWRKRAVVPLVVVALLTVLGLARGDGGDWRDTSYAQIHIEQLAGMALSAVYTESYEVRPEDVEVTAHDLSGERRVDGGARNILLVVLEGIPGAYVEPVAEFFDVPRPIDMAGLSNIAGRSYIVPNFLTHKQQTIRGLYSMLCGDYPKLAGGTPKALEMIESAGRERDCLPAVLANNGFHTAFIQAAGLEYMSKNTVMPFIGFQDVRGRRSFDESDETGSGWGLRDRDFFRQALPMIEELDDGEDPWFATLLTVGTHHPYEVDARDVERYGSDKLAAVMAADTAVAEFFDGLVERGIAEDTLIIITSDESHGVPKHPHGNVWGLMMAHGPGIQPGVNPGVFATVDTTVSILDYFGIEPPEAAMGRSIFRSYDEERVVPFAVGRRFGLTEKKGVFHICQRKKIGAIVNENATYECRTRTMDSGEMFSKRYRFATSDEYRTSYERVYRLQTLLDGSVTRGRGGERLVLARNAVTSVRDNREFVLLAGQFFEVPPGKSARVVLKLRYETEGDETLRLRHQWVATDRGVEGGRDARAAMFDVPVVEPGGVLRLVFQVGGLDDFYSFEAIAKAQGGPGRVIVDEYSIEFVAGDASDFGLFRLIESRLRYPWGGAKKLIEIELSDERRVLTDMPLYREDSTITMTDRTEHLRYTMGVGWWPVEPWAAWSKERAHIYLNLDEIRGDHLFTVRMVGYPRSVPDERRVELLVNGRHITTWDVGDRESPFKRYQAVIREDLLRAGVNTFVLHPLGGLVSSFDLGLTGDRRPLGIGVRSFSLSRTDTG